MFLCSGEGAVRGEGRGEKGAATLGCRGERIQDEPPTLIQSYLFQTPGSPAGVRPAGTHEQRQRELGMRPQAWHGCPSTGA